MNKINKDNVLLFDKKKTSHRERGNLLLGLMLKRAFLWAKSVGIQTGAITEIKMVELAM